VRGRALLLHREREGPVREDVGRPRRRRCWLDVPCPEEVDDGGGTQERVVVGREEGAFGHRVRAPARAAHALEERRDAAWRIDLNDVIEVADVDAELERARGDDDAVGALLERLLSGGSL
jgi:hypothetical protein